MIESISTDSVVSLEDVKAHLRIDYSDEDELLQQMLATATKACRAYIGERGEAAAPDVLAAAIKMHVATMFASRFEGTIPADALDLMREHREFVF